MPRLLNPNPRADQTRKSRKAETRLAKTLDGRTLPGSGSFAFAPGKSSEGADVRTRRFLLEHKRTDLDAMTLQVDWFDKIRNNARRAGKDPGLVFEIQRDAPWIALQGHNAREALAGLDTSKCPVRDVKRTITLPRPWLLALSGETIPVFALSTPTGPWFVMPLELAKASMA